MDPHDRAPVREVVRAGGAATVRGARPSRSSTRTTSPGGTCGAIACPRRPARARVAPVAARNFETPEQLHRSPQAAAAALAAGHRGGLVRARSPSQAPKRVQSGWSSSTCTCKLQRDVDGHIGQVLQTLQSQPRGRGQHGDRVHLRPRRVRRLARPARQGRGAYEEGIRVPLIVKDPRGVLTREPEAAAHPADLERRRRAAVADDRQRVGRLARAGALRTPRRTRSTSRRSSPTPTRPAAPTCCTRPTRPSPSTRSNRTPPTRRCTWSRCARPQAKYATYSSWAAKGHRSRSRDGEERELYDYSTDSGRLELHNSAGESALEAGSQRDATSSASSRSCAGRCPRTLGDAHARGFATTSTSPGTPPTAPPQRANAAPNGTSKNSRNAAGPPPAKAA